MISNEEIKDGLCVVTISDTGVLHQVSGKKNQDCISYTVDNGDFVLAVSDGVGSCSKAELGSKFAVEAALKVFAKIKSARKECGLRLPALIINEWFSFIGDNTIDDYCATLKAAFKIGKKITLLSIGDGLLVLTSKGMHVMAPQDDSLFTNNTDCLRNQVHAADFWIQEFETDLYITYAVMACTDGVANYIQPGQEVELVRTLEEEMKGEELQEELEKLLISIADYSSDDRTLGVVKYEWKDAEPDR